MVQHLAVFDANGLEKPLLGQREGGEVAEFPAPGPIESPSADSVEMAYDVDDVPERVWQEHVTLRR
jgi:hypothetical protein